MKKSGAEASEDLRKIGRRRDNDTCSRKAADRREAQFGDADGDMGFRGLAVCSAGDERPAEHAVGFRSQPA